MLGVTTTTWDKWRNVVETKGVVFIADKGGEQEDAQMAVKRQKRPDGAL